MDPGRAARLRENKRKFRSRRKEYITDLERSLRDLRQQGVQATQEVQLSARRVDRENVRLRQLLRHVGVDDAVVESWVQDNENIASRPPMGTRGLLEEDAAQLISSNSDEKTQGNNIGTTADETPPHQPAIWKPDSKEAQSAGQCLASPSCLSSRKCHRTSPSCISETSPATQPERASFSRISSNAQTESACISKTNSAIQPGNPCIAQASSTTSLATCKLISRLAVNPGADITQIPVAPGTVGQSEEADGVECSRAYQMLMQFATTEDKLDSVALALESGCVANKGPGGGCKVPNRVVWKALDDIQD